MGDGKNEKINNFLCSIDDDDINAYSTSGNNRGWL